MYHTSVLVTVISLQLSGQDEIHVSSHRTVISESLLLPPEWWHPQTGNARVAALSTHPCSRPCPAATRPPKL
jgi:hypothetical protein